MVEDLIHIQRSMIGGYIKKTLMLNPWPIFPELNGILVTLAHRDNHKCNKYDT